MTTTDTQPTTDTAVCGDTLDSAIGTIVCDLPVGHDGPHAGGDRTYWIDRTERHIGYVEGLRKAAEWLDWMAEAPPEADLDPETIGRMAAGVAAMARSAAERLGVEASR